MSAGADLSYQACPIKRARRSKAAVRDLKQVIYDIVAADHPMTVRQVFYQLVQRGSIEKSEDQYQQTVVRLLATMRIAGELPFSWIVDHSRRRQVTRTFSNVTEAVADTARFYRRSALRDAPAYVEVWVEKDALSGIMWDATCDYDVPPAVVEGNAVPHLPSHDCRTDAIRVGGARTSNLPLPIRRPRSDWRFDPKNHRSTTAGVLP